MNLFQWLKGLFKSNKVKVEPLPKVNEPVSQEVKLPEVTGLFREPKFVRVSGIKTPPKGKYSTKSGMFAGLVVHYTESGRTKQAAINVLKWLVNHKDKYCCMVMDEDGFIYIPEDYDVLRSRGTHAGKSSWNGYHGLNAYFNGMEICGWGLGYKGADARSVLTQDGYIIAGRYQAFTKAQEDELSNFILWAKYVNPEFSLDNICGHDEARVAVGMRGDKQDPGGALSMSMPAYRSHIKKFYRNATGK